MSDLRFLSFDIGGTKIVYSIINEHGKILEKGEKHQTPKTLDAIFTLLKDICSRYETQIDGVAIATPGEVNPENSKIISSVGNMPKGYMDLDFSKISKKPVYLENDANAAMWGELHAGAAKGYRNAMLMAIGTGVGLAFVVDGKLLKGKSGGAAEAHFPINRGNVRQCSCGFYDCYEIYASGTALGIDAKEAYGDENADSHTVIKGLEDGDPRAEKAFDRWQKDVIDGIIGMVNLFDPEIVIMFGSLTEFMNYHKLQEDVNRHILGSPIILRRAILENDAAMIGAAIGAGQKLRGKI